MIIADNPNDKQYCFKACDSGTYCKCQGKTIPDYSGLLKPIGTGWETEDK